MVLLVQVRASMYPTAISYLVKTYGEATLGSTTGFMFIACGVTNLLVYPSTLLVNLALGGDVRPLLAVIGAVPTIPHILAAKRLARYRAGVGSHFPPVWMNMMAAVKASPMHRWGIATGSGTRRCPICLSSPMARPIELSCTHVLCSGCATKMSGAGMRKCPICRHPHLLDPKTLRQRQDTWRHDYSKWRQGKGQGAKGQFSAIRAPAAIRSPLTRGGDSNRGHASEAGASLLVRGLDLAIVSTTRGAGGARRLDLASSSLKAAGPSAASARMSGRGIPGQTAPRLRSTATKLECVECMEC